MLNIYANSTGSGKTAQCAVLPEPLLFAHAIYTVRGSFRENPTDLGPVDSRTSASEQSKNDILRKHPFGVRGLTWLFGYSGLCLVSQCYKWNVMYPVMRKQNKINKAINKAARMYL